MKNMKPFRSLSMGFATLGLVLSQQGCVFKWIKDKMGCSHCKEAPVHGGHGSLPAASSVVGGRDSVGAAFSTYKIDITPDTSGHEMIRFAPGNSFKVEFSFPDAPVITDVGFEDKVSAMVGPMMPKGFKLQSLPQQQLAMLQADIVKIESLRRAELETLLGTETFRKKLAQRIESDLNGLVFEYVLEKVKSRVSVSADDIANEYKDNKNRYVKELGGIKLVATKYSNLEDAQQFFAVLTDKDVRDVADFSREAKDSPGQFRDFGLVSKEFPRGAASSLVEVVEGFAEYPSLDIVTASDDEHWVVLATEARETSFYSFEECKQRIASMMEQRLVEKMVGEYIESAKNKVGAEIISSNFANEKKEVDEDDKGLMGAPDEFLDEEDRIDMRSQEDLTEEDAELLSRPGG